MKYACPVCDEPFDTPWESSFDICPSCGIQYGYDDADKDTAPIVYEEWRRGWEENGRQPLEKEQEAVVFSRIRQRLE